MTKQQRAKKIKDTEAQAVICLRHSYRNDLVTEMTHAGEDHGHAGFVGGIDDFLITH